MWPYADPVLLPSELDADRIMSAAAPVLGRVSFPTRNNGGLLACAVSGGADSLVLAMLAVASGLTIEIHHVDHGLRPDSEADAMFVEEFGRKLAASFERRVAFVGHRVHVSAGPNVEARARSARFGALPRVVATGHTADDVAETLLINLVRGSGLDGLAVLRNDGDRLHPIRSVRRAETLRFCGDVGIEPFNDPMNEDRSLQRVRMRTEVLPLLESVANRDVVPLLVRMGDVASSDVDLLEDLAGRIDATSVKALAEAPTPLAKRALRRWLRDFGPGGGYAPSLAVVDRVYQVANGDAVATDIGNGWRVARTAQKLRLESGVATGDVPR